MEDHGGSGRRTELQVLRRRSSTWRKNYHEVLDGVALVRYGNRSDGIDLAA